MEITKPPSNEATENVTVQASTEQSTFEPTTIMPEITTVTEQTGTTFSQIEFQPIYAFYYGGQPNEVANQIQITTADPVQSTEAMQPSTTSKPKLMHNSIDNRSDRSEFKPSIQYEHKSYRFDVDEHFVPIVGPQQIF